MHSHRHRPDHILFVVENNTVPTDVRVWKEAKTARKNGYDVSIIAPKSRVFSKKHEVIDGIHIYRHPAFNNGRGKINQLLEYGTACLWESILSWRVFLKRRFDVIHGANPPDHVFLIAKAFRPFGVRFVFDHHDLAPELFQGKFNSRQNLFYRLLILMERYSCRSADAVISTNESYKRIVLRRHGLRPEGVFVVRNDPEVETEPTRPLPREVPIGGPTKLLYVGSINNQDGVDLLIKSLHLLVRQLRQTKIHCTVIGDGDHLESVRRLCEELGIGTFLTFTGYIHDRRIVKNYIAEADICLETAPDNEANRKSTFIKVMEYMLAGKPVVAFDLEETRFTLQNSGLLVAPNRLDHFAEAIQKLIEDPSEGRRLGELARARILDGLNWSNAAREMIRAYDFAGARLQRNPAPLQSGPVDGL
jgi:glycosyltransferase involved in cell wall biosynthesis